MKEKILEALRDLGFKLEEEEGMGYCFNYEGLNLLYMYNENDEEFLTIALPGIVEVEEDKMLQICALLEKINSTLKYIKAYILGNSVWLFYERELIVSREQMGEGQLCGEEDLMTVISRMILQLEAGLVFARKVMAEIEETMANDFSADDTAESAEEIDAEEIADDEDNE
ncbi:MAG: hypothetical protein MST03_09320 [Bacteroidales bacterium]|nr:hypothetical protein [Bacteroidales bacterium]